MNLVFPSSNRIPAIVMLLVLVITIQACANGRSARRGKLSDAMEKASNQNSGSREIEVPDNAKDDVHLPFLPIYSEDRNVERPPNEKIGTELSEPNISNQEKEKIDINPFGVSGGVGLLKSDDFSEMLFLDLSFGFPENKSWYEIYVGGAWAGIDQTSELDASIDNGILLFNVGFNYKHKLSSNPKWNTPYFLLGAAYKRMYWSYNNEITTTDGDIITSDILDGIEIHAGIGKSFFKTNGNKFGLEVVPAFIFWSSQTSEGFDNDVFDPFFMFKIQAVFSSW